MRHLPLAALAVTLLSGSVLAQDAKVLSGKDAFGGWKNDAPGTTRHLTADDLEAPFVSKSASNTAQPVPMMTTFSTVGWDMEAWKRTQSRGVAGLQLRRCSRRVTPRDRD